MFLPVTCLYYILQSHGQSAPQSRNGCRSVLVTGSSCGRVWPHLEALPKQGREQGGLRCCLLHFHLEMLDQH